MASASVDPIYQRYHGAGFSPSLVLIFTPTLVLASIGMTLNISLIYVTLKCRNKLNKMFNLLMVYDAVWATLYESSYVIRFAIPLLGINYIPAHICFYFQMPAVFFAAQLITMFFIAWERLLSLLFPVWFANRKAISMKVFSVLVIGLSLAHVSFINTLIGIGIFANDQSRQKELLCNMGDYSGPLDKYWAYLINTTLEYSNFAIYSVMWFFIFHLRIKRQQISSQNNIHLLKAISVIMVIILFGWVVQSQLSPRWTPYLNLSPEATFYYLVFLYIDTIIIASSTNAVVLYIFSSKYRECYEKLFPWLKFGSRSSHAQMNVVQERDYVDHYGKLWPFHANIGKNISQDKLLKNFGFTCIEKHPKILYICCTKTNPAGGRCKFTGIYLKSNGCLYTRGEHEHTKRGKTPQNIGDDYLDQFGKIWKFNSEIGKNVRREIFLNKFGLGTMVTNISGFHLHCEKKGSNGRCKFVGIYLNSNGCLYTRGEHNHEHIEKDPKPNIGDDYVDFYRKKWKFHAKIGKNIPNGIWLSKFAFTAIYPKQKTVNLYCQKQATNGGKCPIKGIYVKANGCLYIRGKHEHKFN